MSGREWRPVPGFEAAFEVSSDGLLRRLSDGQIKGANPTGYVMANLNDRAGRKISSPLHRVVALAFHGPPPAGYVVDHVDGDKTNNAAANLEYVTPKENTHRAMRLGLFHRSGRYRGWREREAAAALGVAVEDLTGEPDDA